MRTVTIDKERAHHVKWAFEAYAEGGWTLLTLTEELNRRGLTTVPTPKLASRPVGSRQVNAMLTNPFYTGVVTFKDAQYPGKHEPLIDSVTFEKVQSIMRSRVHGERSRKHVHYLKSTVFCGNCGSRLMVQHNRSGGNNEVYEYYSCTGRHAKRTDCNFRSIQINHLESLIQRHYDHISIGPKLRSTLETMLRQTLKHLRKSENQEQEELQAAKQQIERKQRKLLEAHYNDAIPVDLLKEQQQLLDQELTAINRTLSNHIATVTDAETLITHALTLCENIGQTYQYAPEHIRRLLNQLIFERLNVLYDEHEGEWKIEATYTPEFAIFEDGRIRIVAGHLERESKKLTIAGEFSLDSLPEALSYDVISTCQSAVVGLFSCNTEKLQHLRKHLAEASQGQDGGDSGRLIQNREPTRGKNRAGIISKSEAEKIAVDYVAGKSTKQLATELGRSRAAISESLKRSGVKMRTFRKSSPEEIQQMVMLYASGLSLVRVAERVGYSEKTVWVQLRRAGVEMRAANR